MKRKTVLVSSFLSILLATGIVVGATYSLFTSESTHNITVGSGKVSVTSVVDEPTMELYSMGEKMEGTTFANGGSVTLTEGGTIKLNYITPGDSVKFKVRIKNESNVAVKYKVSMSKEVDDLANELTFTGPTVDLWETLPPKSGDPYEGILTDFYEIVFPNKEEDQNSLQKLSTTVHIKVEAIQGNAPQAQNYSVNFNSQFGTFDSLSLQPGQTITLPQVPEQTGYTFAGWYTTSDFKEGTNFTLVEMPMENIELYAKWTTNKYSITFEENGGSSVTDLTGVEYNSPITLPTSTLVGHELDGWYKDNGTFAQKVSYTTMPAETLTLYAKWNTLSYNLILHTNEGTIEGPTTKSTEYNSVLSLPTPTKTGYTFDYWCTDEQLQHKNTITNMPAEALNLYAKYTINEVTITFDSKGGDYVAPITQNYNTTVEAPDAPFKTDLEFGGWFTDDETFSNEFTFSKMPAKSLTLYAKWNPIDVSNYVFDAYEGSGNTTAMFSGFKNPNTKDTIILPTQVLLPGETSNYNVTAIDIDAFKDDKSIKKVILPTKLEYIENGAFNGSTVSDIKFPQTLIQIGSTSFENCANLKEIVIPSSVAVIGQRAFSNCTDLTIKVTNPNTINRMPNQDWALGLNESCRVIVGEENFNDNNSYTVTYNNDGKTESKQVINGGKLIHPTYTKDGYKFAGWYLDAQFNNPLKLNFMPKGGLTLYAKWDKIIVNKTITYQMNGATSAQIQPLTAEVGSEISAPKEPQKTDHWFDGWYTDPSLTNKFEFKTMPDQDTKLYAGWVEDIYKYNLLEDGTYEINGLKDWNCVLPDNPRIPTTHLGVPITKLNHSPFENEGVSTIDIPSGITTLSNYFVQANPKLRKIFIPATVVTIGDRLTTTTNLTIFTEHLTKPDGWHIDWCNNKDDRIVRWGATHQDFLDF